MWPGPNWNGRWAPASVGLQWVIGGYALTLGAGLILGGRLGDRYGRRRMFLIGLASFTATSLLCACAPDIGSLIAFRLLQGTAGAMLLPQGLGLLRENFSGAELTKVFGIFGPVLGLGGIIGPVLGGGLIQSDFLGLGWRLVFLVNLPIGIAALVVAAKVVPRRPGDRTVVVDMVGAALVALSCALLVLPLNQGQEAGWPLWTWLCMAGSVTGFGAFALRQRSTAAKGREPLVTPALLRKPAFTVGLGGIALFFAGLVGTQLVLTLYLQIGLHFTAGEAGLGNLPLAVGTAIGGAVSGAVLADRIGRAVLQIGPLVQLMRRRPARLRTRPPGRLVLHLGHRPRRRRLGHRRGHGHRGVVQLHPRGRRRPRDRLRLRRALRGPVDRRLDRGGRLRLRVLRRRQDRRLRVRLPARADRAVLPAGRLPGHDLPAPEEGAAGG